MDPMMELVNALNALTAALQKFSSQTTNAYLDTFEEIYDPEKDEPGSIDVIFNTSIDDWGPAYTVQENS